jgi:hypothetical protein
MTNALFEQTANEIKKQITKLNLTENFTLFKADEFAFSNRVVSNNQGALYNIMYVMEIHHPLTGYKIAINTNIEDVEIAAGEIIRVMVKDFAEHFKNS